MVTMVFNDIGIGVLNTLCGNIFGTKKEKNLVLHTSCQYCMTLLGRHQFTTIRMFGMSTPIPKATVAKSNLVVEFGSV